ncbi:urate oxidase [Nocardioidaceae bacterium]|nr:urate oxidase [Nocardioidaceae bacterium]
MSDSPPRSGIVLGDNQFGKAEVRLVRVDREGYPQRPGEPRHHVLHDLSVTSLLRGDFAAAHTDGDNSGVIATDTQKNTVFAFARQHGVSTPEQFLLTLADHFVGTFDHVTGGRWSAEQYTWDRIVTGSGDDAAPHDHAFVRGGRETRTALVHRDGDAVHVLAGVADLTVLKSTGSEFSGFPRDRYTSLAETDDRVLATDVTAWWRYTPGREPADYDATYAEVRDLLLARFAEVHSLALQQTVFAMGRAVLEAHPEITEIRLSCPNNHHFLVDLSAYDLDNPGEVFHAADRPYGLIEAAVRREDTVEGPAVWASVTGFC